MLGSSNVLRPSKPKWNLFASEIMRLLLRIILLLAPLSSGFAQTSTNLDGSITLLHGQSGGGGPQQTNDSLVTSDSSIATGEAGGEISAADHVLAYSGFIGQFYDPAAGFGVTATPFSIDEGSTRQLVPFHLLDDGTGLAFAASEAAWSISSGPLSNIDANGFATADTVYEDSIASVQATYLSVTETISLPVLDILKDNFGTYASDGLPDDWQVGFFGLDHSEAGPQADPDGDGQTNQFERLAKLDPTDAASAFEIVSREVPGQPSFQNIVFSPVYSDRIYTLQESLDLSPNGWHDLSGPTTDIATERAVTDMSAGDRKFYKVVITDSLDTE